MSPDETPNNPPTSDETTPFRVSLLAMVASDHLPQWDVESLTRELVNRGIKIDGLVPGETSGSGQATLMEIEGNTVGVAAMNRPIPWADLECSCKYAFWWPEAAETLRPHSHHAVVFVRGVVGSPLRRHVVLSHVVDVVARLTEASGICWGNSTLVHEPDEFHRQVRELSDEVSLPHLWVGMRVEPNEDGTLRFFTSGMGAFGRLEIEIPRTAREAAELYQFVYGVVHHLITHDVEIVDGETIGRSQEEKFTIHFGSSLWPEREGDVMRIDF